MELKLADLKVIVIGGNNQWAKADTLDEALKMAGRPKHYFAYIVHPDSRVNEMGAVTYPTGYWPKQIARKLSVKGKAMMRKLEAELDRKPYGDYRDSTPTGEVEEEETPLFADAPAGHSLESDEGVID